MRKLGAILGILAIFWGAALSAHAKNAGGILSPAVAKVLEGKKLLSAKENRGIYDLSQEIFDRLSDAQGSLAGQPDLTHFNRLHILDDLNPNAFVSMSKTPGMSSVENEVFITTGLLKRIFPQSGEAGTYTPEDLRIGSQRLAGVLAHELAHPLDHLDAKGFSRNYGQYLASQTQEFRADGEAVDLLERAGFPREALLDALKTLRREVHGDRQETLKLILRGLSTHPEGEIRESALRHLLTFRRFEKGAQDLVAIKHISLGLGQEIGRLSDGGLPLHFREPASPREILARLKPLVNSQLPAYLREKEYNQLILAMDRMVAAKPVAEFNESDWSDLLSLTDLIAGRHAQYTTQELPEPWSAAEWDYYGRQDPSLGIRGGRAHAEALRREVVYRDPRYLAHVEKELGQRSAENRLRVESLEFLMASPQFKKPRDFRDVDSLSENLDALSRTQLVEKMLEGMPPATAEDAFALLKTYGYENLLRDSFPLTSGGESYDSDSSADFAALSPADQARTRALRKGIYQKVWDQAGYWGTMDVVGDSENIDFPKLWKELGLNPRDARAELSRRMVAFTKTELFKKIAGKIDSFFSGEMRERDKPEKFGRLDHLTLEAWDAFQGNYSMASHLGASALRNSPELFGAAYERALSQELANLDSPELAEAKVKEINSRILRGMHLGREIGFHGLPAPLDEIWARQISQAKLSPDAKRNWLKRLLLSGDAYKNFDYDTYAGNFLFRVGKLWRPDHPNEERRAQTLKILRDEGLATSVGDLLRQLPPGADRVAKVSDFAPELNKEINAVFASSSTAAEKTAYLMATANDLIVPFSAPAEVAHSGPLNDKPLRELKAKLFAEAEKLPLSAAEKFSLFERLTRTGGSDAADAFFQTHILPELDAKNPVARRSLELILSSRRLRSLNLRVTVAENVLNRPLARLAATGASKYPVKALLDRINAWMPDGSFGKDDFLERVAWRLNLDGPLLQVLEDHKSYNYKRIHPMVANVGSMVSGVLAQLKPESRLDFIRYLRISEPGPLPEYLVDEIYQVVFGEMAETIRRPDMLRPAVVEARRRADEIKKNIERTLLDFTPNERIPLIEMALTTGAEPLLQDSASVAHLSREVLGYAPNSSEEKMLQVALEVSPAHERSVALGVLLGQVGEGHHDVAKIYEAFGFSGIRMAQWASRWNLFGSEHSQSIAALEYAARPLSLKEIRDTVKATLSAQDYQKIVRFDRILGSASNKVAVRVALHDGGSAVLIIQRPHARPQFESHLIWAREFLQKAQQEGLGKNLRFVNYMLDQLGEQMREELNVPRGAAAVGKAQVAYADVNERLGEKLNGYTFKVPGLKEGFGVYDNLMVLEEGHGVPYETLPREIKAKVGRPIVESSFYLRTQRGEGDADRNGGNFLVDVDAKTISPIDFDQWHEWSPHDRAVWAKFLPAVLQSNGAAIVEGLEHMAAPKEPLSPTAREALTAEVSRAARGFMGGRPTEAIMDILAAAHEHGVPPSRRFLFGGFMETMTLWGKGYMNPMNFVMSLGASLKAVPPLPAPAAAAHPCDGYAKLVPVAAAPKNQ